MQNIQNGGGGRGQKRRQNQLGLETGSPNEGMVVPGISLEACPSIVAAVVAAWEVMVP